MHEGRDEDGFARARKSRDPETQPAAGKIVFEAFGGDAGFEPRSESCDTGIPSSEKTGLM